MLSSVILAAIIALQTPAAHAGTCVVLGIDSQSQVAGRWRNYSPGRWEELAFHKDGRFQWELRNRMGGERIHGRFKILNENKVELRVAEFRQIGSDAPSPAVDKDDPISFQFQLDSRGDLQLETTGVHKQRPFNLTIFPKRTYFSSANFEASIARLIELLDDDEATSSFKVGNDHGNHP